MLKIDIEPRKESKSKKDKLPNTVTCSDEEATHVLSKLEARFDAIVNRNSKFQDDFHLNTNFCSEESVVTASRRRLIGRQHKDQELSNREHGMFHTFTEPEDEDEMLHRELDLRVFEWQSFFLRGGGVCFFCSQDSSDDRRRRLEDHEKLFYSKSRDMEKELNKELAKELKRYTELDDHCLYKTTPTVAVHMLPVEHQSSQTKCTDPPSLYCCAPEKDPTDVCSKAKKEFKKDGFCHKTQDNCEHECQGVWVDALNPPTER